MIPGNPPDGNSIVEQDHAANPAYADGFADGEAYRTRRQAPPAHPELDLAHRPALLEVVGEEFGHVHIDARELAGFGVSITDPKVIRPNAHFDGFSGLKLLGPQCCPCMEM